MKTPTKLAQFLASPEAAQYFGRSFAIKADVLSHIQTGNGTLGEIARRHGVSRPAVSRHKRRALEIFAAGTGGTGNTTLPVDSAPSA